VRDSSPLTRLETGPPAIPYTRDYFKQLPTRRNLPLQAPPQDRELRRFAFPPLKLDDRFRTVDLLDAPKPTAIVRCGCGRGAALDLNQDDVEQIAALQDVAGWLLGILPDRDEVDDSPPLPLTHSAEGDELPAIGNPRAQGPEYGLRPSTGGVGFDVRLRFDGGHIA
jgi:hypothetical protein